MRLGGSVFCFGRAVPVLLTLLRSVVTFVSAETTPELRYSLAEFYPAIFLGLPGSRGETRGNRRSIALEIIGIPLLPGHTPEVAL